MKNSSNELFMKVRLHQVAKMSSFLQHHLRVLLLPQCALGLEQAAKH